MNSIKLTLFAAALIAVTACTPKAIETTQPGEPERAMSERCEMWITWLVDGNYLPIIGVPKLTLEHISHDCLGRPSTLMRQPMPPFQPLPGQEMPEEPPEEPEQEPEEPEDEPEVNGETVGI